MRNIISVGIKKNKKTDSYIERQNDIDIFIIILFFYKTCKRKPDCKVKNHLDL